MKTKKIKHFSAILTGVIIGSTFFLSTTQPIFADDTLTNSLYTNPSLQYVMQSSTNTTTSQNVQGFQRTTTLRTRLENAMKEHAVIGGIAFIARYEDSSYLPQLQQQVQQNTDQLTTLIGQLYGQDKENQFRTLWNNHIDLLNQYTDARKTNNMYQLQQVNQQLHNTANELAAFFTQNNPSQQAMMQQMIQIHIDDEKAIIDAHAFGQNDNLINLFLQAAQHASMMADQIVQIAPQQMHLHEGDNQPWQHNQH